MSDPKDSLKAKTKEFERYGAKWEKAVDTVLAGGVKEGRFLPSGRRVLTVVGRAGDEFIDPDKPYCSCSNFFFKVIGGREDLCYHLLSYKIAAKTGMVDVVEFSDEEYGPYLTATVRDVFAVLHRGDS